MIVLILRFHGIFAENGESKFSQLPHCAPDHCESSGGLMIVLYFRDN